MDIDIWTREMNLGIDVLDAQHRRIFDYIVQLDRGVDAVDIASIRETFGDLKTYTETHFLFEESLMERAGYEGAELHARTHKVFTRRIWVLFRRFEQEGDLDAAREVSDLLIRWLMKHILEDDQEFVPAMKHYFRTLNGSNWLSRAFHRLSPV